MGGGAEGGGPRHRGWLMERMSLVSRFSTGPQVASPGVNLGEKLNPRHTLLNLNDGTPSP